MSAIATLSRSYDGTSGIGTGIRTKEEIEAGNRRVWQNTVDGFKKISYIIGEFFSVNDAYRLTTGKDPETGENASRLEAAGWLTADLASLGISKVAKGGKLAGKGLKALDKVNDASKATKAVDKASGNLLPMTLDNLQMFAKKPKARPDFYVAPDGRTLPSTAYRYMDSKYAEQTMRTMEAPGSYIGLSKFDSASKVQDAYQISPAWSNAKLRGEFDTLQIMDNVYVPKEAGDTGKVLEPITSYYPEYGKGGYPQLKTNSVIEFKKVDIIGD